MPHTEIWVYRDPKSGSLFMDWWQSLEKHSPKVIPKCIAKIHLLTSLGHELRRPHADYLRDGVYEMRLRLGTVQYRILYGFLKHCKNNAVLLLGCTKEKKVENGDIDRAIKFLELVNDDPPKYTTEFTLI